MTTFCTLLSSQITAMKPNLPPWRRHQADAIVAYLPGVQYGDEIEWALKAYVAKEYRQATATKLDLSTSIDWSAIFAAIVAYCEANQAQCIAYLQMLISMFGG
jgi:hypothetical protein